VFNVAEEAPSAGRIRIVNRWALPTHESPNRLRAEVDFTSARKRARLTAKGHADIGS
jgi:hypothetical protein